MEGRIAQSRLGNSLKLTFAFQLVWIAIAGLCLLIGRPIASHLMVINLTTLFAIPLAELVTRTQFPLALKLHFYVFVTAASFLGSIVGFYGSVPNWDTYVHLDSGILMAWFGFFAVRQAEGSGKTQFPKWFAILTAFAVPMAIASLWEVYEYLSDLIINTNMQVGGLGDTMIDTIAAAVGAIIAIVIAVWPKFPKSVLPKSLR